MKNLERNLDDEMIVQMCNEETLPCKTCKWAVLDGPTCGGCMKFKNKPYNVYFESNSCVQYTENSKFVK